MLKQMLNTEFQWRREDTDEMSRGEDLYSFLLLPRRDPGPSYGEVGPSSGVVWGLKSFCFEGPVGRRSRSVWVYLLPPKHPGIAYNRIRILTLGIQVPSQKVRLDPTMAPT